MHYSIIAEYEQRAAEKQSQVDAIMQAGPIDPREYEKAVKEFNSTRTMWTDRKLQCREVWCNSSIVIYNNTVL